MVPGSKSEIMALKWFDGSVISDMNSVAHHLNVYWQSVFDSKAVDVDKCDRLLAIVHNKFQMSGEDAIPTIDDVKHVIKNLTFAAPGPDSPPHDVFRSMSNVCIQFVYDIVCVLIHETENHIIIKCFTSCRCRR